MKRQTLLQLALELYHTARLSKGTHQCLHAENIVKRWLVAK